MKRRPVSKVTTIFKSNAIKQWFIVKLNFNSIFSVHPPSGDITQKGYEKKRQRLLAPYLSATAVTGSTNNSSSNNNGNASSQGQGKSRIRDQFAFILPDFCSFFICILNLIINENLSCNRKA